MPWPKQLTALPRTSRATKRQSNVKQKAPVHIAPGLFLWSPFRNRSRKKSHAALAAAHVVHDLSVGRGVALFTCVEVGLDGL